MNGNFAAWRNISSRFPIHSFKLRFFHLALSILPCAIVGLAKEAPRIHFFSQHIILKWWITKKTFENWTISYKISYAIYRRHLNFSFLRRLQKNTFHNRNEHSNNFENWKQFIIELSYAHYANWKASFIGDESYSKWIHSAKSKYLIIEWACNGFHQSL